MKFQKSQSSSSPQREAELKALRSIAVGESVNPSSLLALQKRGLVETLDGKTVVTGQGHIEIKFAMAR
jgi:hypothetical protein